MSLVQGYSSDESSGSDIEPPMKEGDNVDILDRLSKHIVGNPEVDLPESHVSYPEIEGSIQKVYLDKGYENTKRNGTSSKGNKKKKQKRNKGNLEDDYLGPWATFSDNEDQLVNDKDPETADNKDSETDINNSDPETPIQPDPEDSKDVDQPSSVYLAKFPYPEGDFLSVPTNKPELLKIPGTQQCFTPKKVVTSLRGHESGISKLEFFPKSGHLLLSGGNDSIIRLWDMYNKRELIREYYGHNQSIKDLMFNSTGTKFLSCSFDRKTHLWDTKTGEILGTIQSATVPTALLFNPNNDDEFLIGLMSGKIEHYHINDLTKPTQVYDHHLSTINIVHSIENGKRFLSASDDKSVRIWNWGINIPAKIITHPTQYAIASLIAIPPNDKYIAMQNMNNTIQVIDGNGKYKFKKKLFKNSNITGYKIEIHISPDGKILMSGDSKGNVLFWDWKTGNLVRKFKISDKMINNIKFHPQEPSKVVAGGLDGKIYFCD